MRLAASVVVAGPLAPSHAPLARLHAPPRAVGQAVARAFAARRRGAL